MRFIRKTKKSMSDDNKQVLTPEEVKAQVAQDLGLDPNDDTNKAVIEKIAAKEIESQKSLSKAIEQKASYRQIAVDNGLLDPVTFEPIKKEDPLQKKSVDKTDQARLDEIDLRSRGYKDEEIEVLARYGGVKALTDPIIMAGINEMRAKKAAEDAVIDGGNGPKSDLERKYTNEQLEAMSVEELEKLIPKGQPK